MAGEKLLSVIKSIADNAIPYTELTNALYGEVLNIKPLTIRIENRFEISESDGNLQVSPLCMENYIHFPKHHHHYPVSDPPPPECKKLTDTPHNHDTDYTTLEFDHLLLWRGLRVGDNVLVLRVSQGQEYVVLYRLGNYSRNEQITDGGGYR